jgi:hypothetical protein
MQPHGPIIIINQSKAVIFEFGAFYKALDPMQIY